MIKPNPVIQSVFDSYPHHVTRKLLEIRELIYEVAREDGINQLEETLKWGEPSYIAQSGSTIRIDWKSKHADRYFLFFNCKTTLIETFKEVYGDTFVFEGNRAIVLCLDQTAPKKELKHCLSMSLNYHKIKHLPLLGA